VEKGSIGTEIGNGLVDPKENSKRIKKRIVQGNLNFFKFLLDQFRNSKRENG